MTGTLISTLIRRETDRLRKLGRGYEAAARAATGTVETIHRKELDARQERLSISRTLRKRTA